MMNKDKKQSKINNLLAGVRGLAEKYKVQEQVAGAFKGLIASVPCIGSPLIGAWEGYHSARMKDAINSLSERVEKLGAEKIDYGYIESEEFVDLFFKILRAIQQSRSRKKAKLFESFLIESMGQDRNLQYSIELKEIFVATLSGLSDTAIEALYLFSKGRFSQKGRESVYQMGDTSQAIAVDELFANGILMREGPWNPPIVASKLGQELIAYLNVLATKNRLDEKAI